MALTPAQRREFDRALRKEFRRGRWWFLAPLGSVLLFGALMIWVQSGEAPRWVMLMGAGIAAFGMPVAKIQNLLARRRRSR